MSALARRSALLLIAALSALFVLSGPAMTRAAEADEFIRTVGADTLKTLADKGMTAQRRETLMRDLLTKHLDLEAVGRFCLGRYNRNLTEEQRAEYGKLFEDYLVKVYAGLLAQYDGQTLTVHDNTRESEGIILVSSQVNRANGPPIRVEWKVAAKDGAPKVTDVVVEGVSMAFTQRQQFESVLQNNGGKMQALFDAMKKQISR